jgi:hypothetical protein
MHKQVVILGVLLITACTSEMKRGVEVTGELKKWHTVTLQVKGPESSEWARTNPFLDYRLEGTFTRGERSFTVPGFFAADGKAAETSADQGNLWKIRFLPDETGTWEYTLSFRKGKDLVLSSFSDAGEPVPGDGLQGSFEISDTDKTGNDFRAKGRLINGRKGYLVFQETGEVWIKNGADSPENFLAYRDFDQTLRYSLKTEVREGEADPQKDLHAYEPHVGDWKKGDPTWKNGKGKGIIGALNYLASQGVNSQYMLTMNILGDGKDVWPYSDPNERTRFDCSKLDQWEIVFSHMDHLGMMIHFVLQETENETLLDNGYMDVQRMVYLRELVARFAHHPAVTWNLGEENGPASWSPIGQTETQIKAMASYLKKINPYPCFVVLHTHADDGKQDEYLTPMLGGSFINGPSMQIGNPYKVHERIKKWISRSESSGERWVVNLDEIGPHWKGVLPDSHDPDHDTIRRECLWGTLMAGGAGAEWYFGYRYPHTDLTCEDFRSREKWWQQTAIATSFIRALPVQSMTNADHRMHDQGWCLAEEGKLYIAYMPQNIQPAKMFLASEKEFSVRWFNPRTGREGQTGSIPVVKGPGEVSLGFPPEKKEMDWVAVVQ